MEVVPRPPNPYKSGVAEQFQYKNRLQEYAQKTSIPLPLYQTVNEGYPHAPQFRSTVVIDGTTFRSYHTFLHRKDAEQEIAKIALENISNKVKAEDVSLMYEDSIFCKSILHEYAVKVNLPIPSYTTSPAEGLFPMFVSSLVFDEKTYTGYEAKNKKDAEQIAAQTVIESILENSSTRAFMSQIIKSKRRLYAALPKGSGSGPSKQNKMALKMQSKNSSSEINGKDVECNLTNDNLLGNNIAYLEAGQPANAAKAPWLPPDAKKLEEEYICRSSPHSGKKHRNEDQGGYLSKKARAD